MTTRILAALLLVLTAGAPDAFAWGCDGHRAVAFIAERLLPPPTLAAVKATLAAAPIDPALRRFCDPPSDDPIVDSTTWADDYRDIDASTFTWHFINVPRQVDVSASSYRRYCPDGGCVIEAIAEQFRVLTTATDAMTKGNALRFLLHFIGDMHQPMHTTANADRGGNCVPVTYKDRVPQQNASGDYSPNLHSVWDTGIVRTLMTTRGLSNAQALAAFIAAQRPLPAAVAKQPATKPIVAQWAQDAHLQGRNVGYAKLPVTIPLEPPLTTPLASCADNRDIAGRMLAKHVVIDAQYEAAGIPVVVTQLRLAGIRVAAVLNAAFP